MLYSSARLFARQFINQTLRHRPERSFCTVQSAVSETGEAQDNESILNAAKKNKELRSDIACSNIILLAKLNTEQTQKEDIKQDERFSKILRKLETDVRTCDPMALISCLKALQNLGIASDSYVVRNLENALVWLSRTCPIKDLVMSFSFAANRKETDSQKMLFSEVCTNLERRWVELQDGKLFVPLFLNSGKLSAQLLTKLEDRIQDCVEDMSATEQVNILVTFGKIGRRNMPILRSIGFHIAKNRGFLDIKQIADVLFAYNKLSFKEQDTLERICSGLESLVQGNDNLPVLRSILTSLGQLKLPATSVLDLICDWYEKRLEEGKTVEMKDLTTLLLTLSSLNHTPADKQAFMQKLGENLSESEVRSSGGDLLWLNVVWSLVSLNLATEKHISTVLDPKFYTSLLEKEEAKFVAWRLLNVNAAAKLLIEDYKGPVIDVQESPALVEAELTASAQRLKFKKFVFETLSTLFPPPRFVNETVRTGLGLNPDLEVVLDTNAKPLQIQQYATNVLSGQPSKSLPAGASRLAIFITPFQEALVGGGRTGSTDLNLRLAEASGYVPLLIDHTTIDSKMKTISRVQKLDVLVKQALEKKKKT